MCLTQAFMYLEWHFIRFKLVMRAKKKLYKAIPTFLNAHNTCKIAICFAFFCAVCLAHFYLQDVF